MIHCFTLTFLISDPARIINSVSSVTTAGPSLASSKTKTGRTRAGFAAADSARFCSRGPLTSAPSLNCV